MKWGLFNGFVTSSLLNHYFVVNDTKPNVTRTRIIPVKTNTIFIQKC